MADFGKINLDFKKLPKTNTSAEGITSDTSTSADPIKKQLDFLYILMVGVVIALLLGFITCITAFFQFSREANIDYKNSTFQFNNTVKEFNNEKNQMFEQRIKDLENKFVSPTPTKSK